MLVLSRKLHQKILLPDIKATLQIVGIKPGMVRIGFEGPDNVSIFREEIFDPEKWQNDQQQREQDLQAMTRRLMHEVRNRLNASAIGLVLLKQQFERGMLEAIPKTIERIEQEITQLCQSVNNTSSDTETDQSKDTEQSATSALLVEDDHNERELLAGFLRLAGVKVATAGDGADALDYLGKNSAPDFVLMDLSLPRCDGLTAARAIRKESRYDETKIFAVTGMERNDVAINGSSPVDGWFQKPLNPELLLREMQ